MPRVADIIAWLEDVAPPALAEPWDNVGLLLGDAGGDVSSVMTCLTLTPDVAAEAIAGRAELIVTHHPILFRPVQRLTADTAEGRLLLDLAAARVAVYSPHTGYDSARDGINQQLAQRLGLQDIAPLRPLVAPPATGAGPEDEGERIGSGRHGALPAPMTLAEFLNLVKHRLDLGHIPYVGDPTGEIRRVGIACGSAAEFLRDAHRHGCQVLLTGEARFHAALEARGLGIALVLTGHYASERPAVERLAERIAERFPDLSAWPSRDETDPIQWD